MFVMNVSGGFANQLFRFACGYQISKKYKQEMIIQFYDKSSYVDALLLDELSIPDCKRLYMRVEHDPERTRELLNLEKVVVIDENNFGTLSAESFAENTLVYVDAPFQKTIYFDDCINDIRNMFKLRHISEEMHFFKQKIYNQNSVAVHVRRRDFVDARNAAGEQDINGFYKSAIVYFRKNIKNPHFYVFSDDLSFCIDYFGTKADINFVKIPGGKDADMEEFFCISWCKHRILTKGSSFGRMADLLNGGKDKITLYQGEEKARDHIIYLGQKKIEELYREYDDGRIENKMQEAVTKAPDMYFDYRRNFDGNILAVYLEKIKRQYEAGRFACAEQTLIKAWQYGYNESLLHKYYYKVLKALSKNKESLIEALAYLKSGGEQREIEKDFSAADVKKLESFMKMGALNFFVIPKESYRNAELNQLCNLGILLQRMGYNVHFIFHKAQNGDNLNVATNNEILASNYMYTNCEGYMYQSKMYDWDIIKKQYDLDKFITSVAGDGTCYIISDNLNVLEECKGEGSLKIYWKAINTYRYYQENAEIGQSEVLHVDRIITDRKEDELTDKYVVIKKMPLAIKTEERVSLSRQYAYDEELFYVIEQLILGGSK